MGTVGGEEDWANGLGALDNRRRYPRAFGFRGAGQPSIMFSCVQEDLGVYAFVNFFFPKISEKHETNTRT